MQGRYAVADGNDSQAPQAQSQAPAGETYALAEVAPGVSRQGLAQAILGKQTRQTREQAAADPQLNFRERQEAQQVASRFSQAPSRKNLEAMLPNAPPMKLAERVALAEQVKTLLANPDALHAATLGPHAAAGPAQDFRQGGELALGRTAEMPFDLSQGNKIQVAEQPSGEMRNGAEPTRDHWGRKVEDTGDIVPEHQTQDLTPGQPPTLDITPAGAGAKGNTEDTQDIVPAARPEMPGFRKAQPQAQVSPPAKKPGFGKPKPLAEGDAVTTSYPGKDKYARVLKVHPDGKVDVLVGTQRIMGPVDPKALKADPAKVIDEIAPKPQPQADTPTPPTDEEPTRIDIHAPGPVKVEAPKPHELPSNAKLTHHDFERSDVEAAAKYLGIKVDDIPNLVGAPNDSKVNVAVRPGEQLHVVTDGPGYSNDRIIYRDEHGKLVIHNEVIQVDKSKRRGGIAAQIFAKQAYWASKHGVDSIEMQAARSDNPRTEMNGYIVWARLGVDGPIPDASLTAYQRPSDGKIMGTAELSKYITEKGNKVIQSEGWNQVARPTPHGEKTVQELMQTPEGLRWWERYGTSYDGTFDTKPGSKDMQFLDRSVRTKWFRDLDKKLVAGFNKSEEAKAATAPKKPMAEDITPNETPTQEDLKLPPEEPKPKPGFKKAPQPAAEGNPSLKDLFPSLKDRVEYEINRAQRNAGDDPPYRDLISSIIDSESPKDPKDLDLELGSALREHFVKTVPNAKSFGKVGELVKSGGEYQIPSGGWIGDNVRVIVPGIRAVGPIPGVSEPGRGEHDYLILKARTEPIAASDTTSKPGFKKAVNPDQVMASAIAGPAGAARDHVISELYSTYLPKLQGYAARKVGDADADDVAQNTFAKFLEPARVKGFDPSKGTLQNYLFGIAKNEITEMQRARSKGSGGGEDLDSGRSTSEARSTPKAPQWTPEKLAKAANKINPEGGLTSLRDLRKKTGLPKAEFDALVLETADGERAFLHEHDAPSHLTPEERQYLVKDEAGREHVGIQFEKTPQKRVVSFKTAKGSTYTVDSEGRTQRTKTAHVGHLSNDTGLKEASAKTVYVSPEAAQAFGMLQSLSAKTKGIIVRGDSVSSAYFNEHTGKWVKDAGPFPIHSNPAVGLAPVEFWGKPTEEGGAAMFKNWHPGNSIVEVGHESAPSTKPPRPVGTKSMTSEDRSTLKTLNDELAKVRVNPLPTDAKSQRAILDHIDEIQAKAGGDKPSAIKRFVEEFFGDEGGAAPADFIMDILAGAGRGAKNVVQTVARGFHPSGALMGEGDFVRQAMYKRDAAISAMQSEYEFAHRDLDAALQAMPHAAAAVNEALGDAKKIASLPANLQAATRKVRDTIDAMTDRAIATGNIQGKLLATFQANKGLYMHQQYRKFERPDWVSEIDEPTWNQVVAEMKTDPQFKGLPEAELRKLAYNLAAGDTKNNSVLDIVKSRKNPAKWVKTLFGLEEDPLLNSAETVRRMSTLVANMEMWNTIGKEGEAAGAFVNDLFAKKGYSTPMAGQESSIVKQGIEGLFTSKEVKDAIEKLMAPQGLVNSKNQLVKLVGQTFAMSSAAKTIGSVGTQFNNYLSSGLNFLAKHGTSLGTAGLRSDLADATRIMKLRGIAGLHSNLTGAEKVRLEALTKEMAEGGLFTDSPTSHMLSDAARVATQSKSKWKNHPAIKTLGRIFVQAPVELYAAGDQFWKAADYLATKRDLLAAGMSEAAARAEAADRANRHNQSYKRHGVIQKTLTQIPVMGGIGAMYQFDQPRMLTQRIVDIVKDIKSGNPKLRAKAIGHLAGIIMVNGGIPYAIGIAARLAYGITAQEEEEAREHMAPWDQNAQLMTLGRDADGNLREFNVGRSVPMGGLMKTIVALARGKPLEALMEFASPIVNPKLPSEAGFDILRNQTGSGRKVFNPEDSAANIATDVGGRVLQAFTPGSADAAYRVYKSVADPEGETGRKYNTGDEVAGFFGARPTTVDVRKSLQFKARDYEERMKNADRLLTDPAKKGGDLATAHANMERARQEIFDDLQKKIQAAKVVMINSDKPLDSAETAHILNAGGLGKQEAKDVVAGIHKVKPADLPSLKPDQQAKVAKLAEATANEKGGATREAFQKQQDDTLLGHLRALSAPKPQIPKRRLGEKTPLFEERKAKAAESLEKWQTNKAEAIEYVASRGLDKSAIAKRYAVELRDKFKEPETRQQHGFRLKKALAGN